MVTLDQLRKLALSFPEVTEEPHFEKTSFRVKKKIFATFNQKEETAVIKLPILNDNFDSATIYPVPGAWGRQGWTVIELKKISWDMFKELLLSAYCEVAPKKLSQKIINDI